MTACLYIRWYCVSPSAEKSESAIVQIGFGITRPVIGARQQASRWPRADMILVHGTLTKIFPVPLQHTHGCVGISGSIHVHCPLPEHSRHRVSPAPHPRSRTSTSSTAVLRVHPTYTVIRL